MRKALGYAAALIAVYLVVVHASGAGTVIKGSTSGAGTVIKALQGR
jgi:hypothetical protein